MEQVDGEEKSGKTKTIGKQISCQIYATECSAVLLISSLVRKLNSVQIQELVLPVCSDTLHE